MSAVEEDATRAQADGFAWAGWTELWIALGVLAFSLAAFFLAALAGWPGAPNGCVAGNSCFCETFRAGMVKQPANTGSNLGFITVGLLVAWQAARARREAGPRPAENHISRGPWVSGVYAAVVVFLGPGSMFLHASFTRWGGRVDVMSMYLFATFVIAYNLARVFGWGNPRLLRAFAVLAALMVAWCWGVAAYSNLVFGVLVGTIILTEAWLRVRQPEVAIDRRYLYVGGAAFALAFAIWLPSRTGGALCNPDSLLQGHAIWHLLSAFTCGCIYLAYRSEDRPQRLAR